MFCILSFIICHGLLSHIPTVSGKQCDPANYICSGSCPKVPPKVELPYDVAICMKDSITKACVCWLKSDTSHTSSLFLCEALINNSVSQILCHTPTHCFPPDSEPTCLVIPYCNCLLMKDESSSALQFGDWKPVKAIIKSTQASGKYPTHVQEFNVKHLLFLLGFVIAPLLCWCLLNFVTEKKWRCKTVNCPEAQLMNTDRNTLNENASNVVDSDILPNFSTTNFQLSLNQSQEQSTQTSDIISSSQMRNYGKDENPPTYDEAMHGHSSQEEENTPPPAYEDCVHRSDNI